MTATVDTKPSLISPTGIVSNAAVRSSTWADVAQVLNMSRGFGSVLVAAHFVNEVIPTQTSYTYRYRATPTLATSRMVWIVNIDSVSPSVQLTPTYSPGIQVGVSPTQGGMPTLVIDDATAVPLIDTEFTITITTGSGSTARVTSISLVEMPRTELAASEGGVDLSTLRSGDPIYDGPGASYSAIGASVASVMAVARRVAHSHWFRVIPYVRTATSFASPLTSGTAPTALTRRILASDATRTLTVRAYAEALVQPGEVRITGVKNASAVTLNVPVGAAAWTAIGQILVDAEAAGSVNGLQAGTFDTLAIAARTTVSGGTVRLHGWSVWESENDV